MSVRSLAIALLAIVVATSPTAGRAPGQEPEFPPCRIRGVLVDTSGQPRANVPLRFEGGGSSAVPGRPRWTRPDPVTTSDDGAFLFSFEKPGGVFWISVEDERFEAARWHFLGIADGEQVDLGRLRLAEATLLQVSLVDENGGLLTVSLRGTSGLTLDVRDLRSDRPIETYRLEEHRIPASRIVRLAGAPCPEGGRYDGFVAGDFDLALFVEGRPTRSLRVTALAPGETRMLRVLFGAGQTLLGRVVDAAGQPLTSGKVRVAAYVAEGLRAPSRKGSPRRDDRERTEVALRPDGTFDLQGIVCGTYDVTVELPDGRRAVAIVDVPQTVPLELQPTRSEEPPTAPRAEEGGR